MSRKKKSWRGIRRNLDLPRHLPAVPPADSSELRAKAIPIVGPSGSGKTELICRLLDWLVRQGLKVAVLKHTHHHDLGDQGKDTWRFRQAGARVVALAAPGLLQISRCLPEEPPLAPILAELAPGSDLILVEGYKTGHLPKVGAGASGSRLPDAAGLSPVVAWVSARPSGPTRSAGVSSSTGWRKSAGLSGISSRAG